MAVELEELIAKFADQRQPQLGEGLGRHPRLGLDQHLRVDAHRAQLGVACLRPITQGMQHGVEKVHRDRVAIAHGRSPLSMLSGKKCQVA